MNDFDPGRVAWAFTDAEVEILKQVLLDSEEFTFDLETTGLDEHAITGGESNKGIAARVVLAQFTVKALDDGLDTWILPLSHPDSPFCGRWRNVLRDVLEPVVERGDIGIIGQNVKFDCRWVYATTGLDISPMVVWDTRLSSHLLDETRTTRLKVRAAETFGIDRWDDFDLSYPGAAEEVALFDLAMYGARDTYWTHRLYQLHKEMMFIGTDEEPFTPDEIENARLGQVNRFLVVPTVSTLTAVEQRGIGLDQDWVRKTIKEYTEESDRLYETLANFYPEAKTENGDPLLPENASFAPTSHWFRAWTAHAVEVGDLRVAEMTPGGKPKWSRNVLVRQANGGSELAQMLLDHRKFTKRLEFLRSWLTFVTPESRIHANYNVGRTVTGRLSSDSPNLQQVTAALKPAFVPRPGFVFADLDYCLEGSMRILTSDLRWVAADEIKVGEKIIGFPEKVGKGAGRSHTYEEAEVTSVKTLTRPSVAILLEDGRIVKCSAEHRWLSFGQGKNSGGRRWIEAGKLVTGDIIPTLTEPWDEPDPVDAAYLRGFLDGEGWVSETTAGWGQLPGGVRDEVVECSKRLGIEWRQRNHINNGVEQHIVTTMNESLRILGMVRPHRLLPKARKVWEGRQTYGKYNTGVRVIKVIDVGEQAVVAVGTSTKTMIVEGLLSHNSQIELRVAAFVSRCEPMIAAFQNGDDLHNLLAARITGKDPSDVLPEERQKGKCFHPDTEVLTRTGWVKIIDLKPGQEVMQGIPSSDGSMGLEWTVPLQVYTQPNEHDHLVHLYNEGMDIVVTPDHAMLGQTVSGKWVERLPDQMPSVRSWPNSGILAGGDDIDEYVLRLAVAVQADGSYANTQAVRFGFTKMRKIERLRDLLVRVGLRFTETVSADGVTRFYIPDGARGLLNPDKTIPWNWLDLSERSREIVLDEARWWDGTKADGARAYRYLSTNQHNIDVMQALAAITGRKTRDDGTGRLTIRAKSSSRGGNLAVERIPYTDHVACLAVESGVVIVRHGGVVIVTKQSANFGLLYGMSSYGFKMYAETAYGVSMTNRESAQVHRTFFEMWQGMSEWHLRAAMRARQTGQVVSPIGRVRRLPEIHSGNSEMEAFAERAAVNAPVQGFASDLMMMSAASIEGRLFGRGKVEDARIIGTVHDSILVEVPEDNWREVTEQCIERMVGVVADLKRFHCEFDVPLAVEAKVGTRWGVSDVGSV